MDGITPLMVGIVIDVTKAGATIVILNAPNLIVSLLRNHTPGFVVRNAITDAMLYSNCLMMSKGD